MEYNNHMRSIRIELNTPTAMHETTQSHSRSLRQKGNTMDNSNMQPASPPLYVKLWGLRKFLNFTPVFATGLTLWLLLLPAIFSGNGRISLSFNDAQGSLDATELFLIFLIASVLVGLYTPLLLRKHRLVAILWSSYTVMYHFALLLPALIRVWNAQAAVAPHMSYWPADALWSQLSEEILPSVIKNCCISLVLFWLLYIIVRLCTKLYANKLSPESTDAADQPAPLLNTRKEYLPLLLNLLLLLPLVATIILAIAHKKNLDYGTINTLGSTMGYIFLAVFFLLFPICAGIYCAKNQARAYLQMKTVAYTFFSFASVMLLVYVLFFDDFNFHTASNIEVYLLCSAFSIVIFTCVASYRVGKMQGNDEAVTLFPKSAKTILPSCITLFGYAVFLLLAPQLLLVQYEPPVSPNYIVLIAADSFVTMWLTTMSVAFAILYTGWCIFKASKPLRAMLCSFIILAIAILGNFLYRSVEGITPAAFFTMAFVYLISAWLFFGFYSLGKWIAKRKLKKKALAAS